MPELERVVRRDDVRGQVALHAGLAQTGLASRHVVLLRHHHREVLPLVAPVLAVLDAAHALLVDQLGRLGVFHDVVPRREYLLPEEEPPGRSGLLDPLLLGELLALGDGVQDVVRAATQRGHLDTGRHWGDNGDMKSC